MPEYDAEIQYRDIQGFPGYKVGNDGTVWSCWGKGRRIGFVNYWHKMVPTPLKSGHLYVSLTRNKRPHKHLVHRLVLTAFVGPCPPKMEGCHFPDRNPANNSIDNLRWDYAKGNGQDRVKHGTTNQGEQSTQSILTDAAIQEAKALYALGGWTFAALGLKYGVCRHAIADAVKGRRWRHLPKAPTIKGINKRGERHNLAILTEADVAAIRAEYVPRKVPLRVFAERYGVSESTVSCVVLRKAWAHIA